MSAASAASTPTRLGQYDIERRLGAGGMAEVFLAKKQGAEGMVKWLVVKRVLPHHGKSHRFQEMFIAEARLATMLNHPNIVQVYDFQDIRDEGQILAMEYVEGPDLGRVLSVARARDVRLPPWVAAYVIAEAAKGLHYAHERKSDAGVPLAIVHRDVSPQNILVSFDGAVKIADFGIASANLFREEGGVLKGKFGYMSPEQASGEVVDRRSDIYSLGVCLHEMLTGRYLHGALVGEPLLETVRRGEIEPPSTYRREIPPELEAVAMKALARSPDGRYQTARDMAGAISRALIARQELVDAASVEAVVGQLIKRQYTTQETTDPGGGSSVAGSEVAREGHTRNEVASEQPGSDPGEATGASTAPERRLPPRGSREVRHVAVVTLTLFGAEELERVAGKQRAEFSLEQVRKTLGDIAYKHGCQWLWEPGPRARTVVGLLANSSRAAAEAAALAVRTHEALADSFDLEAPLEASIAIVRGVATGEREADGRLVRHALVPPVEYLAALLGARTPTGRTWVAGGLYRMVRRDFRWGDAPTVEIPPQPGRSLPPTMRVYALERPLSSEERLAEQALAPSDLVGRDAEKADLHAAYHRAVTREEGARGLLVSRVVIGEMGIGKTALVAAFLADLPPEARVLRLEASQVRIELPFGAIGDLTREALHLDEDASPEDARRAAIAALGPMARGSQGEATVARVVELAAGGSVPIQAQDGDDLAYRHKQLATAMRRLLTALASRHPLVVVCDGLQWIDRPSLELMTELVRRTDPLPILAILLTRPDDRVMGFLEGVVRIDLQGLSHDEQARLVEMRLGVREGVAAVCAELVPRVAGNPFFLLEMIDAMLERGALELQALPSGDAALVRHDQGQGHGALPSTLEQILGDRLRELPPGERAVVEWLAVANRALSLAELSALLGASWDPDAVIRLCARGLCDQPREGVDFRHAITREVAYQAIEQARREQLHRRFGEHLLGTGRARGLEAAIVARHFARGAAPEQAATLYLEAGQTARLSYQTQLATRYLHRALKLLPPGDPRRLEAHELLEGIYRILGRSEDRHAQLGALRALARSLARPRWVALSLARSARLALDEGTLARGLPLARKAAEAARIAHAPDIEVEAQSIASELRRELGDLPGALAACDAALEVADAHAAVPPRTRAEVLRARGTILRRLGKLSEAIEAYAEAIAVCRRCGARRQEARAKNGLAMAMLVSESWEDTISLGLDSIRIDLSIGGRFQIAKTMTNIGQAYARLGDLPRALAYLRRAREAHERYADQDARADTLLVSAEAVLHAGDLNAAHGFCRDASALNSITGSRYDAIHEALLRALIARAHADASSALACAVEARALARDNGLTSFGLYAGAIEARSRVDLGFSGEGELAALEALDAAESTPSEYGVEIRTLCCEALDRAGSPGAPSARDRAARHLLSVAGRVRDERLRRLFFDRPAVRAILQPPPLAP
jgi:serine/threonine protein kinase/tetratricopeptide (TPR) repeat protein